MGAKRWAMLAFLAAGIAFSFQGSRGLYETTEGRYAEVGREMLERRDFVTPRLGYRPHWTKPPLTYWAIAAGIKLIGRNEWGVRVYNAVAFLLLTLLIAWIGSLLWDVSTGFWAGIVFLSSPFPIVGTNMASTDLLLTLWVVLAIACYLKASRLSGSAARLWRWGMWLAWGIGFLTKGPALLVPLFAIGLYDLVFHKGKQMLDLIGWGLFSFVGVSWYLLAIYAYPELLSFFLREQITGRLLQDIFHRNPQWYAPLIIYLPVLLIGPGGWSFFVGRALLQRRDSLRYKWSELFFSSAAPSAFLCFWFFFPFLVFCVAKSRLPLYLLPLYPPLALLAGRVIDREIASGKLKESTVMGMALATLLLLGGVKGYAAGLVSSKNMQMLYAAYQKQSQTEEQAFLFAQERLYGLQFYLNGNLLRISVTGREPWADLSLDQFLKDVRAEKKGEENIVIVDTASLPYLKGALAKAGISIGVRHSLRHWFLVKVRSE